MPSIIPVRRNVLKRPVVVQTPSGTPATWNPLDVGASFILSNSNLTATGTSPPFGSPTGGRATNSHSTGHFYFEMLMGASGSLNDIQIGAVTGSWDENSLLINTANGAVIRVSDGLMGFNSNNQLSGLSGFTNNDVMGMDLNLTGGTFAFNKNGGSFSSTLSLTGISTPVFAGAYFTNTNIGSITARFASSSWTGTPPSGATQL